MYKVAADKGFQILSAVFPNLIFINGPKFARVEEFANRFKSLGFNILKLDNVYQRLALKFKPKKTKEESMAYIHDHFAMLNTEAELGEFPKEITDTLINELHTYFNKFQQMPCVVVGDIGRLKVLDAIFNEKYAVYTYVYVYPNNATDYQSRIMTAITSSSEVTKKEFLSTFETLTYEYQAWKRAPKEAKENAQKTFHESFKKYVKLLLSRRKNVFTAHSEDLGRAFVILD